MRFLGDFTQDEFGIRPNRFISKPDYLNVPSGVTPINPEIAANINPMAGSLAGLSSPSMPMFNTSPGLRIPAQGSEPGLRMPTGDAPLSTQFAQPNAQLLGLAANIFNRAQQRPQQSPPQPTGLLQPMQQMGDFRTLYANYLKQRGLLA